MCVILSSHFYFSFIIYGPFRIHNICHGHYTFCRPKQSCKSSHIVHTQIRHTTSTFFIKESRPCWPCMSVLTMSTCNTAQLSFLNCFTHKRKLRTVYHCRCSPQPDLLT